MLVGHYDIIRGKMRYSLSNESTKKMYEDGASDKEIAEAFGATVDAVINWRKRNGLTPNKHKKEPYDWKAHGFTSNPKDCEGCVFWRSVESNLRMQKFCNHLLDTGKCKVVVDDICQSRRGTYE